MSKPYVGCKRCREKAKYYTRQSGVACERHATKEQRQPRNRITWSKAKDCPR